MQCMQCMAVDADSSCSTVMYERSAFNLTLNFRYMRQYPELDISYLPETTLYIRWQATVSGTKPKMSKNSYRYHTMNILILLVCLLTASALPLTSRSPQQEHSQSSTEEATVSDQREAREATTDCMSGENCTNTTSLTTEGADEDGTSENASLQGMACTYGSLKQLLAQQYGSLKDLRVDKSVFPFFVYPEILHLERGKEDTETSRQQHRMNCFFLKESLNKLSKDSICSWEYECRYNSNEFPRYQLEATRCGNPIGTQDGRIQCSQVQQQMRYAKKNRNGCWTIHDKQVRLGCKCIIPKKNM